MPRGFIFNLSVAPNFIMMMIMVIVYNFIMKIVYNYNDNALGVYLLYLQIIHLPIICE